MKKRALMLILVLCPIPLVAEQSMAQDLCLYESKGRMVQVNSLDQVPAELRGSARCFKPSIADEKPEAYPPRAPLAPLKSPPGSSLAAPSEIKLDGLLRQESLSSSLGRIHLRWPRSAELLFGRTPERAVVEAARVTSKALKQGAFPPRVQTLDLEWKIVFMEKDPPAGQVPPYLISSCHPAWMTPPANVYVVAERVAKGCGTGSAPSKTVADSTLAQILVHEMGHAVEFYLMNSLRPFQPMRSEGFATWFESYASGFSSIISASALRRSQQMLAKEAFAAGSGEFRFSGSAADYARASLYFKLIEKRRGISGVVDLYELIVKKQLPLEAAVEEFLGLGPDSLAKELKKLLE